MQLVSDPNVSLHAAPEFRITEPGAAVRKPERIGIGYLAAPILGQTADAWTTYEGLKRGFRESNPFMAPFTQRPALFALGKVGAGFAFAFWAKKLADRGHARAGKGLAIAAGFLGVVPAAFNVATMARSGR